MASDAQIRANRANAKRSTGPVSRTGRRRVAGNARRHGLTDANLDANLVLFFYRTILEDPLASPEGAIGNEYREVSLNLARSEARLVKVRDAVTDLDQRIAQLVSRIEKDGLIAERYAALGQFFEDAGLSASSAKNPNHWFYDKLEIVGDIGKREPLYKAFEERRILMRYRNEAVSGRRKALKRWIDCENDTSIEVPWRRVTIDWASKERHK